MGDKTNIAWTNKTFNAWEGCTKVSSACDNCYAEERDKRFHGGVHWGPKADRKLTKTWGNPIKWNKEAYARGIRIKVFCASLADVFDNHKSILPEWRKELWALIKETPHLDWQLLTKRPQNIEKFLPADWGDDGYPNVWLGTTVENQEEADRRIKKLLRIPAAHHFLSCEPLLGEIDLTSVAWPLEGNPNERANVLSGQIGGYLRSSVRCVRTIDWVICGGESGPKARPFMLEQAYSLMRQGVDHEVAFFMKQLGCDPRAPWDDNFKLTHKKGEDPTEWPPELRVQQFPGDV